MIDNPPGEWEEVEAPFLRRRYTHPTGHRITYDSENDVLTFEKSDGEGWEVVNKIRKSWVRKYARILILGAMTDIEKSGQDDCDSYVCDCGEQFQSQRKYAGHQNSCDIQATAKSEN